MKPSSFSLRALEFYGTRFRHRGQWRIHSGLRKLLRADIGGELEVKRGGLTWVLNPSDYTQNSFFWLGEMDHWNCWHVKRMLSPQSVIFDIGANFGYYSLTLSAYLERDCRVIAVEPHPVTRARLERNIALNAMESVITVIPCGLSDCKEISYMAGFAAEHTGRAYCSSAHSDTPVTMTTLDDVAQMSGLTRLDFLKLDVEGFEERALRGGEQTLRRFHPALLVEFMPKQLERAGSSADSLSAYLRSLGYRLFIPHRQSLTPLTRLPDESLFDVFCLPETHR